jgi:hypothetical protein
VENPRPEREAILDNPQTTINITYGIGPQPVFGTMTQGAGLRAAFDANPEKPFALSAASYISINGDNIIGRNWQGITDNNKGIRATRIVVYAPLNGRLFGNGSSAWRFEGSNDGVSYTAISSGTTVGVVAEIIDVTFLPVDFFLYHRFVLAGNGIHSVSVAMLHIYQQLTGPYVGTGPIPPPPAGFVYLTGPDGAYLFGPDGSFLLAPI